MTLEEALQQEVDRQKAGVRYKDVRTLEPLTESIRRRVRLIRDCWTLSPDPDFYYQWADFRQYRHYTVEVWPGDEGYEDLAKESVMVNAARLINIRMYYQMSLESSPWTSLIPKQL